MNDGEQVNGLVRGRDIVSALRRRLSKLDPADRLLAIDQQIYALERIPPDTMQIDPAKLILAWQALRQAYEIHYAHVTYRSELNNLQHIGILCSTAQHEVAAAHAFDEAGAQLLGQVLAPNRANNAA